MRRLLPGLALLALLAAATLHQAETMRHRPVELKLGPVLSPALVRLLAGEHAGALAFRAVTRVMFYFGSFFDDDPNRVQKAPEYAAMYQHLGQAVQLDPYNLDAYYFAQAAFTWEVGRAREVNLLLDKGIGHRRWDYSLPFYAGFNAAFFLKDYPQAARYFQMAAERSGNPLFTGLAARYFNEAGQTQLGISYLETMIKGASDHKTRLIYAKRRDALLAVRTIEQAMARYRERYGQRPGHLGDLVARGLLPAIPVDPYGGTFYLDEQNRVRTSSKFALQFPDKAPLSPRLPDHEE